LAKNDLQPVLLAGAILFHCLNVVGFEKSFIFIYLLKYLLFAVLCLLEAE
jgi:hypothetical protein